MGFQLIIPAAGSGSRLGGEAKQIRLLGGQPVLVRAILAFLGQSSLERIIVATGADLLPATREALASLDLRIHWDVVEGGDTRQDSVRLALEASTEPPELTLIHDAVRPFVSESIIVATMTEAGLTGAACPAVPVSDTLRRESGGVFGKTVDRSGLYAVQTPQAFKSSEIMLAHKTAHSAAVTATDDAELYRQFVGPVSVVAGSPANLKITTPDDWDLAQAVFVGRQSLGAIE